MRRRGWNARPKRARPFGDRRGTGRRAAITRRPGRPIGRLRCPIARTLGVRYAAAARKMRERPQTLLRCPEGDRDGALRAFPPLCIYDLRSSSSRSIRLERGPFRPLGRLGPRHQRCRGTKFIKSLPSDSAQRTQKNTTNKKQYLSRGRNPALATLQPFECEKEFLVRLCLRGVPTVTTAVSTPVTTGRRAVRQARSTPRCRSSFAPAG